MTEGGGSGAQDKGREKTLSDEVVRLIGSGEVRDLGPFADSDLQDRKQDRELKELYAKRFIWILVGQLAVMNLVFLFAGFAWAKFDRWTLNIYMTGTLGEVFGIVVIITKSLFRKSMSPRP